MLLLAAFFFCLVLASRLPKDASLSKTPAGLGAFTALYDELVVAIMSLLGPVAVRQWTLVSQRHRVMALRVLEAKYGYSNPGSGLLEPDYSKLLLHFEGSSFPGLPRCLIERPEFHDRSKPEQPVICVPDTFNFLSENSETTLPLCAARFEYLDRYEMNVLAGIFFQALKRNQYTGHLAEVARRFPKVLQHAPLGSPALMVVDALVRAPSDPNLRTIAALMADAGPQLAITLLGEPTMDPDSVLDLLCSAPMCYPSLLNLLLDRGQGSIICALAQRRTDFFLSCSSSEPSRAFWERLLEMGEAGKVIATALRVQEDCQAGCDALLNDPMGMEGLSELAFQRLLHEQAADELIISLVSRHTCLHHNFFLLALRYKRHGKLLDALAGAVHFPNIRSRETVIRALGEVALPAGLLADLPAPTLQALFRELAKSSDFSEASLRPILGLINFGSLLSCINMLQALGRPRCIPEILGKLSGLLARDGLKGSDLESYLAMMEALVYMPHGASLTRGMAKLLQRYCTADELCKFWDHHMASHFVCLSAGSDVPRRIAKIWKLRGDHRVCFDYIAFGLPPAKFRKLLKKMAKNGTIHRVYFKLLADPETHRAAIAWLAQSGLLSRSCACLLGVLGGETLVIKDLLQVLDNLDHSAEDVNRLLPLCLKHELPDSLLVRVLEKLPKHKIDRGFVLEAAEKGAGGLYSDQTIMYMVKRCASFKPMALLELEGALPFRRSAEFVSRIASMK